MLFADECALVSHSLKEMQGLVYKFAKAASALGLNISIKKWSLFIYINGKMVNTLEWFNYLGW